MKPPPAPVTVELLRDAREVRVLWDDDHRSVYTLRYLRGFCPCAACQGHAPSTWTFVPSEDPMVVRIAETGAYALSVTFSDGHDSGIYSFEILRELCPCAACQALLGARHALATLPTDQSL